MTKAITCTKQEEEFLKQKYKELGAQACAIQLNTTVQKVYSLARKLKVTTAVNLYTEEENQFIIHNYCSLGRVGCAEVLGRTPNSIQTNAQKLGVRLYVHTAWSEDDLLVLRANFSSLGGLGCANLLGRSFFATHKMAEKLGLSINWKGYYVDEFGYKVLLLSGRKKMYEHRYVMSQHLGRLLTAKEIVHHIDEDKLNNELSNLLVCSRAEHINLHREALLKAQMAKLIVEKC